MRTLLILVVWVAVIHASVFRSQIKSTGSFRKKLIRTGVYHKFLEQQLINRATGTEPLMDYYDNFYLVNVTIGTPPQEFTLTPDTSSANVWVIDTTCTSQACKGFPDSGHIKHQYDKTKSSTFIADGKFFMFNYGDGGCRGYMAGDTLSIAGLKIQVQKFGSSTYIDNNFGYLPVDGIIGLGWPALAIDSVVPPMQNLLPQLDQPIFTFWLDRKIRFSEGSVGGQLTIGDVDTEHCEQKTTWKALSSQSYWQFEIDGFKIGAYSKSVKQQAISSTGTSFLGGPTTYIANIVKEIGGSFDMYNQIYYIPCSAQKTAPDLIFYINGDELAIPPMEYIVDENLGNNDCMLDFFDMNGGGYGPAWIFGDTFIRTFCTTYDIGNKRIGFSVAKHSEI